MVRLHNSVARAASYNDPNEVLQFVNELSKHERATCRDDEGKTILHYAAMATSNALTVDLVDRYEFPVFCADLQGVHPIHHAAAAGVLDIVEFYVRKGIHPCIPDGDGKGPIHYALGSTRTTVAQWLNGHGGSEEAVAAYVKDLKRKSMLQKSSSEFHSLWSEVEKAVLLVDSVPLTPLPWDLDKLVQECTPLEAPASSPRKVGFGGVAVEESNSVWLCVSTGKAALVAGMLFLDQEYLFEGHFFYQGATFTSPLGTSTSCTIYRGLSAPTVLQCFHHHPTDLTLLRSYILLEPPAPAPEEGATEDGEAALQVPKKKNINFLDETFLSYRVPSYEESIKFKKLSQRLADSFLSKPLRDLDRSTVIVGRMLLWSSRIGRFRDVMQMTLSKMRRVVQFFTRALARKMYWKGIARMVFSSFRAYAIDELKKCALSYYPALTRVFTAASNDPLLLEQCLEAVIRENQAKYVDASSSLRKGYYEPFSYHVSLTNLCRVMSEQCDVVDLSTMLVNSRSMRMAGSKRTNSSQFSSLDDQARRRMNVVINDLIELFFNDRGEYTPLIRRNTDMEDSVLGGELSQSGSMASKKWKSVKTMMSVRSLFSKRGGSKASTFGRRVDSAGEFFSDGEEEEEEPPAYTDPSRVTLVCSSESIVPKIVGNRRQLRLLVMERQSEPKGRNYISFQTEEMKNFTPMVSMRRPSFLNRSLPRVDAMESIKLTSAEDLKTPLVPTVPQPSPFGSQATSVRKKRSVTVTMDSSLPPAPVAVPEAPPVQAKPKTKRELLVEGVTFGELIPSPQLSPRNSTPASSEN